MKKNYYFIFILFSFLISSCAGGWSSLSPVNEGELIDMGHYQITIPNGKNWSVKTNMSQGFVTLIKDEQDDIITSIAVLTGRIDSFWVDFSVEKSVISKSILMKEYRYLCSREGKSYYVSNCTRKFVQIGDKLTDAIYYRIIDVSTAKEVSIQYAMYVYLPPDYKERKLFYSFMIGEPEKIDDIEYEIDLTLIEQVIENFEEKI